MQKYRSSAVLATAEQLNLNDINQVNRWGIMWEPSGPGGKSFPGFTLPGGGRMTVIDGGWIVRVEKTGILTSMSDEDFKDSYYEVPKEAAELPEPVEGMMKRVAHANTSLTALFGNEIAVGIMSGRLATIDEAIAALKPPIRIGGSIDRMFKRVHEIWSQQDDKNIAEATAGVAARTTEVPQDDLPSDSRVGSERADESSGRGEGGRGPVEAPGDAASELHSDGEGAPEDVSDRDVAR